MKNRRTYNVYIEKDGVTTLVKILAFDVDGALRCAKLHNPKHFIHTPELAIKDGKSK